MQCILTLRYEDTTFRLVFFPAQPVVVLILVPVPFQLQHTHSRVVAAHRVMMMQQQRQQQRGSSSGSSSSSGCGGGGSGASSEPVKMIAISVKSTITKSPRCSFLVRLTLFLKAGLCPASAAAQLSMYSRPPLEASASQGQQPQQDPSHAPWDAGNRTGFYAGNQQHMPAQQQQQQQQQQAPWSAAGAPPHVNRPFRTQTLPPTPNILSPSSNAVTFVQRTTPYQKLLFATKLLLFLAPTYVPAF